MGFIRPIAGGCLLLVTAASCAGEGIRDPVAPMPSCTDASPFSPKFSCIQQFVFTPTCAVAGCHLAPNAQQGLDLSEGHSYTSLVGMASVEMGGLLRVAPADPNHSYVVLKLEGNPALITGERMPFGGPYLSQPEIDVIRAWILEGAPDD